MVIMFIASFTTIFAQTDNYWSRDINTPSSLLAGAVVGGNAGASAVHYNPALIDRDLTHEFKHFRGAFAIGHAYIPEATQGDTKFVVIPTIGLDIQYWISNKWGIALKNDIELANYVVPDDDNGNLIIRDTPVVVALPILFSPWDNQFTFIMGPGIEFEGHENFFVFRVGVGSEFEVGDHWDFAPEIIYDLKDGHINSITFAIGVGKRF